RLTTRDRGRRRRVALVALALLLPCLVAAAVVLILRTPKGPISVQTDDPNLEVVVEAGEKIVRIVDRETNQTWKLDAHNYTLSMAEGADGLQIKLPDETAFVLYRKGKAALSIRRVPAAEPADNLQRSRIPEEALTWAGGGDAGDASPDLVAILGDG